MKIAIVAGPYASVPPALYGGTEQVIFYLIKGLQAAGHEPILLGPRTSKVDCAVIPTINFLIGFPKNRFEKRVTNFRLTSYGRHTSQQLRRLLPEINVIHSHGFDLTGFEDFPNVTTVHNAMTFDDISYFDAHAKLRYVAISENQRQTFPNVNWTSVVYNGEDPADFKFNARPANYLCFLGRMDQEKNPQIAIQLAIKLGMKIKLAGKVDYFGRTYFKDILRPWLFHPLVEYLGELGNKDKVNLLRNAKCNLHPTNFREPFGLTVIEAAMVGTPTVAIRRGALPELIQDGKTGILVEDFIEAYWQISKCYQMDRAYIARRAAKLFNHTNMTRGYIKAYEAAIADTKAKKQN